MSVHKLSLVRSFFVAFSPSPKLALQYIYTDCSIWTTSAIYRAVRCIAKVKSVGYCNEEKSNFEDRYICSNYQVNMLGLLFWFWTSSCHQHETENLHTWDNLNWGNMMPLLKLGHFCTMDKHLVLCFTIIGYIYKSPWYCNILGIAIQG